jgi:hypothetical protein
VKALLITRDSLIAIESNPRFRVKFVELLGRAFARAATREQELAGILQHQPQFLPDAALEVSMQEVPRGCLPHRWATGERASSVMNKT